MSTTPGAGGIAHGLQQNIRGRVLALGQPGFSAAAHLFNPRFDHTVPSAVARPIDAVDVRDAVRYLVSKATPMGARSGGHSYAGYSTIANGVVLDLRRLNAITV
jgi:FAD/FMN-containing dehydrogenase